MSSTCYKLCEIVLTH